MKLYNKNTLLWHRRQNRTEQTNSEKLLWNRLRSRQFLGLKFRRQYSVESYVLDFYCPKKKIAIEIDGGYHINRIEADQNRDMYLEACGIRTLRVSTSEVVTKIEQVLIKIEEFVKSVER